MVDPPNMTDQDLTLIFLKIQHVHGQKMIDPPFPKYDRAGSHLEFFFKDLTCPLKIPGEILACYTGEREEGVNHLLTMHMLNL